MSTPELPNVNASINEKSTQDSSDQDESINESKNREESFFDVNTFFTTESKYLQLIRKNVSIFKTIHLDIQPSWDGMVISEMTRKEFDMSVHANIIRSMLLNIKGFIRTAGYMEHFLKNDGKILKMLLCPMDYTSILQLLSNEKSPTFISFVGVRLEQGLANVCKILMKNDRVQKYIDLRGIHLLPRYVRKFKEELMLLYETMNPQLVKTAENIQDRTKMLRKAWTGWNEKQSAISILDDNITQERNIFEAKMKAKELDVMYLRRKIEAYLLSSQELKDDLKKTNESVMTHELEASEYRQEALSVLAKESIESYQNLISGHLDLEKTLRAKRYKVESQLMNWITKFDTVMMAKQEELDVLLESYEKETVDFIELQCLYNEQKRVYNKYREQHDREQNQIFEMRLYKLRANRAARIIQRCWRKYRQRKLLKRKLKKEKAKAKKAEIAARKKGK